MLNELFLLLILVTPPIAVMLYVYRRHAGIIEHEPDEEYTRLINAKIERNEIIITVPSDKVIGVPVK